MGCKLLIFLIGSILSGMIICPRVDVTNTLFYQTLIDMVLAIVADKFSKTFIKPEVIPPFHCDKISKPLMRNFMANNIASGCVHMASLLVSPNESVIVENAARVFHSSHIVFNSKDTVTFLERVFNSKETLIELDRFAMD